MRKFVYISGAVTIALSLLGILFKVHHWVGASIIFTVGFVLMALVFVPSVAKYLYDKGK